MNKIPGPRTIPILGNVTLLSGSDEKFWIQLRKVAREYSPITKLWIGPFTARVIIQHPDDIEIILSSQKYITKGTDYKQIYAWLKTGLITSSGTKWRQRRKLLTPIFHFSSFKHYLEIINDHAIQLINDLKLEGNEIVQELTPFCTEFSLNVILETSMGNNLEKMGKESAASYVKAIHDYGLCIFYRTFKTLLPKWIVDHFHPIGRIEKSALKTLHDFTNKFVRDRRIYHENTKNKYLEEFTNDMNTSSVNDTYIINGDKKRLAMLDYLLLSEKKGIIDHEGILEEVNTFTFAGHDTVSSSLIFTLMLLAENKKEQDIARDEVTKILDANGGVVTMNEIQNFKYLERCIKESLRLFPPVGVFIRALHEDLQLTNHLIPNGSQVMVLTPNVHRDPNFWEEPDKFDPDRFLPERFNKQHKFAYIPFSAGPRNCIGQKFAIMEMQCLLANILYNYRLEPTEKVADLPLIISFVVRPNVKVYTKFIKINR